MPVKMPKRAAKVRKEPEEPLGTVFNPHVVGEGYIVRFEYDEGSYYEVRLTEDGAIRVRAAGAHSDQLLTEHHVSNDLFVRARRWSNEAMRHVEFVKPEKAGRG